MSKWMIALIAFLAISGLTGCAEPAPQPTECERAGCKSHSYKPGSYPVCACGHVHEPGKR